MTPLRANHIEPSRDDKAITYKGNGTLCEFTVWNGNAGTRYLMLFYGRDVPTDGHHPRRQWTLTTEQTFDGIFPAGIPFKSGITLVMSTTKNVLTQVPKGTDGDALMEASLEI